MSPEYERLNITIEGIQAVIARQDMAFWDSECQLTHNLRLLSNLNIDIKLDTCIAPCVFHRGDITLGAPLAGVILMFMLFNCEPSLI